MVGSDVVVIPQGSWSDELASQVCDRVGVPVLPCSVDRGADRVRIAEGVEGTEVIGPIDELGALVAMAMDGAPVLVTSRVRSARRVVEVVGRLRGARSAG